MLQEKKTEAPQQSLIRELKNNPLSFMENKESFIRAAENFLYIKDKEGKIRPWVCNNTQHMLLNAYFRCKDELRPVRLVVLKGRQQGCSTGVGAIGFMFMMCYIGSNLLIATEEKQGSGKNIFNMYRLYKNMFPLDLDEHTRHEVDNELIEFDQTFNNGLINVSGERRVVSYTYAFIHLSEAAKFADLDVFMDEMLETVPMHLLDTSIFVESTAENYGDSFHELWQMAEKSGEEGVGWEALFIPWFVHEEYEMPFSSEAEREEFAKSLDNSPESRYGNEVALLDIPPIEIPTTNGESKQVGITLENLKWRRDKIAVMKYSLARFYRQYPSTAEEAFLTAQLNVIDRESLSWYTANRVHDPETGERRTPAKAGEFFDRDGVSFIFDFEGTRHPIVTIWEEPRQYHEYILGVDLAQGLESGDFSSGVVICRHPLRVVARLRGFDGRRLDAYEFGRQLYALGKHYNNAIINPENNADGGGVCRLLTEWQYPNLAMEAVITGNPNSKRYGWWNSGTTKKRMVTELQRAFRERIIDITDEVVVEEAKHLIYKSGQSTRGAHVQAAKKGQRRRPGSLPDGYYDDTIFALGGALLLESVLDPPKLPKNIEIEARIKENQSRFKKNSRHYDQNRWLDLV